MTDCPPDFTDDAFLGGRLWLRQPRKGFRAGLDAVMLAAAIPANSGESVLEAGLGNGAASLCLLARVAGLRATGVEFDADTLALAQANAARNGLADSLCALAGDIEAPAKSWGADLPVNAFDHVFANPPYYRSESSRAPSDASRAMAHQRGRDSLDSWLRFLVSHARADATLTLILPPAALEEVIGRLSGRIGNLTLFPLFPRAGDPANRIIIQGRKGSRAPLRIMPGLILHGEGHEFAEGAEAILRQGAALNL